MNIFNKIMIIMKEVKRMLYKLMNEFQKKELLQIIE